MLRARLVPTRILCLAALAAAGATANANTQIEGGAGPDFLRKLADSAGYRVDRSLVGRESLCGESDLQQVNSYDGTLGQGGAYVRQHKFAVGALADGNLPSSSKYCSGTLVGPDLFLTASHCIDSTTTNDYVVLNYEYAAGTRDLLTEEAFRITEVVEDGGGIDYAVLRLEGAPGLKYGWASISVEAPAEGEQLTIVQHPLGQPKQVEIGSLLRTANAYIHYGDIDTEPGSSGSGILDARGRVVGVHTNGGCYSGGGSNSGVRLSAARSSRVLSGLAGVQLPFAGGQAITLVGEGGLALASRADGSVGLEEAGKAGRAAVWQVEAVGDGAFRLTQAGAGGAARYLDGRVEAGTVGTTDAAGEGEWGTLWRATKDTDGRVVLRTVGQGEGAHWLAGGADAGAAGVGLAGTAAAWAVELR